MVEQSIVNDPVFEELLRGFVLWGVGGERWVFGGGGEERLEFGEDEARVEVDVSADC